VNYGRYLDHLARLILPIDTLAKKLKLNEQNYDRIGVYAARMQEGGMDKLLSAGYSEKEVNEVTLTKDEMEFYEASRKVLDELQPEIAEIMKNVYNQDLGKVKDYFSFMTDWERMDEAEVFKRMAGLADEYNRPTKNPELGFTKKRRGGKQKIKINAYEIVSRHIDNAVYLINMARDNRMLFEIANSDMFREKAGARGQRIVLEWVDLISRKGGRGQGNRIPALDVLRKNVGAAVLTFKLTSALIQPVTILDGAAYIGNYSFKGASDVVTNKKWWDFVLQFPEIRTRIGDDPAFRDQTFFKNLQKWGFMGLTYLDKLAAMSIACGAYQKKMAELGRPVDLENVDPEAMRYAQKVVRRTQSSGVFKDVPLAVSRGELTGNVTIDKALFQFQTFMLTKWSVVRHDIWRSGIRAGDPKKAIGMFFWLLLSTITASAIRTGIDKAKKALLNKPLTEYDRFWNNFAQESLQSIPFVNAAISAFLYSSMPIPAIEVISDVGEGVGTMIKGKKPKTKMKGAVRTAGAGAQALGVPGSTETMSIINTILREDEKKSSGDRMRGMRSMRSMRSLR